VDADGGVHLSGVLHALEHERGDVHADVRVGGALADRELGRFAREDDELGPGVDGDLAVGLHQVPALRPGAGGLAEGGEEPPLAGDLSHVGRDRGEAQDVEHRQGAVAQA